MRTVEGSWSQVLSPAFLSILLVATPGPASGQWRSHPGNLSQISVGSARHIWGVVKGEIVRWTGKAGDEWERIAGPSQARVDAVSVGSDGEVWARSPTPRRIFRWTGSGWEPSSRELTRVAVGSRDHVWALGPPGKPSGWSIHRWNGTGWDPIPGYLQEIGVGSDGTVWGVDASQTIHRMQGGGFVPVGGRLAEISVGGKDKVWGISQERDLYRYTGGTWELIGGKFTGVAAGSDGTVRALDHKGDVYGLDPGDRPEKLDTNAPRVADARNIKTYDKRVTFGIAGCEIGVGVSVGLKEGIDVGIIGKECIEEKVKPILDAIRGGAETIAKWALERLKNVPPFSYLLKLKGFIEAVARECKTGELPACILTALKEALGPIGNVVEFAARFVGKVKSKGIGGALHEVRQEIVQRIEGELQKAKEAVADVFKGFRRFLEAETLQASDIQSFANDVFKRTQILVNQFNEKLGAPGFMGDAIGELLSAGITAAVTAAATPIAALYHGLRKLMTVLIPEIIVGGGKVHQFVKELPDRLLEMLPQQLRDVARPLASRAQQIANTLFALVSAKKPGSMGMMVPGALVELLVRDPKKREKLKAFLGKVADVSDRLAQGITNVTKALRERSPAARSLTEVEAILDGEAKAAGEAKTAEPGTAPPQSLQSVLPALKGFLHDELSAALQPRLRDLLGKGLSLLDGLVDVPRNALVAAVGTIPAVGGVLSSALNFGLGFIVNQVKDLLTQQVTDLADKALKDTLDKIEAAIQRKLEDKGGGEAAASFMRLVEDLRKIAEEVSKIARAGAKGFKGSLGALASAALSELLLSGIADTDLRKIVGEAIDWVIGRVTDGSKFRFKDALAAVMERAADPLAQLVARQIPSPLKEPVRDSLRSVLKTLASDVDRALKNPLGFLTEVAKDLVKDEKTRKALAQALVSWAGTFAKEIAGNQALRSALVPKVEDGLKELAKSGFDLSKIVEALNPILAKTLFEGFVVLLERGADQVRPLLAALASRLDVEKGLSEAVLAVVGPGAKAFAQEARKCGRAITGLNRETGADVFNCLKVAIGSAAKTGVVAGAKELFQRFLGLLEGFATGGRGKLTDIARTLEDFAAKVGLKADLDLDGLVGGAGRAFIDRARACGGTITGIDRETGKALLGCLKDALVTAAKELIAGALPEDVRARAVQAIEGMIAFLRSPKPPVGGTGKPSIKRIVIAVLKQLSGPLGDFVASKVPDKLQTKFPQLRGAVKSGVENALRNLDKPPSGKARLGDLKDRFLRNPLGFLTELAKDLVSRHKEKLAAVVVERLAELAPLLRPAKTAVVKLVVGALEKLEEEGFELTRVFDVLEALAAKAAFHAFIEILKTGAEQARKLAGNLKDGLGEVLPKEVSIALDALARGIEGGAKDFVARAKACGPSFAGFNREAAIGLFHCLALALRTGAGAAVAVAAREVFDKLMAALLGGMPDPKRRAELEKRALALVKKVSWGELSASKQMAAALLKEIAAPVGDLVAAPIRNRTLQSVVAKGVAASLTALAAPKGAMGTGAVQGAQIAGRLTSNPLGFLGDLAKDFIRRNKRDLANAIAALAGKLPPPLQTAVSTAVDRLLGDIEKNGFSLANAVAVLNGLLPQSMFDAFIGLLERGQPDAKILLQKLADQLARSFPGVKEAASSLSQVAGTGMKKALREARGCRSAITGFNRESAVGVLSCLSVAFLAGKGAAEKKMARSLFDAFIQSLEKKQGNPQSALRKLTDALARSFPVVALPTAFGMVPNSLVDGVIRGFHPGVRKAVAEVKACGKGITGFNEESAKAVLSCLTVAFRAATEIANRATRKAARDLFDDFVKEVRSSVSGAKQTLQRLAQDLARVVKSAMDVAEPVIQSIQSASERVARDARVCRATISGLNEESAAGVFGCLRLALRTTGGGQAGKGNQAGKAKQAGKGKQAGKAGKQAGKPQSVPGKKKTGPFGIPFGDLFEKTSGSPKKTGSSSKKTSSSSSKKKGKKKSRSFK